VAHSASSREGALNPSLRSTIHLGAHVIDWLRRLGEQVAVVATNNAAAAQSVRLALPPELAEALWIDTLTDSRHAAAAGELAIEVPAVGAMVLIRQP
jgi:hypothetical protein